VYFPTLAPFSTTAVECTNGAEASCCTSIIEAFPFRDA
jgi:hypothetical protein